MFPFARLPLPSSSTRGMPAYSPALYQLLEFQCVPLSTWHTTTPQSPAVYCFQTSSTWHTHPNISVNTATQVVRDTYLQQGTQISSLLQASM